MRDRYFFPLAAAVAGAFVLTALQPFMPRPPRGPLSCGGCANPEDVTAANMELHRFVPGNYDGIAIVETREGRILRITRLAEQAYEDPRSGPHIVIAEDLEFAFESRPIEITIEARAAAAAGASEFEANYLAKAEGESGWQPFSLTLEFQPYTFTFDAPPRGDTTGYDYLGIRPVAPEKQRVMEVRSIRIRAIGPKRTPPA
jgi:hypothetical protein